MLVIFHICYIASYCYSVLAMYILSLFVVYCSTAEGVELPCADKFNDKFYFQMSLFTYSTPIF